MLPYAFFGSRADGAIYRANLITGDGSVFSQGPGTPSLGMKIDLRARLFVAGGTGGDARVVNAISGQILASYTFATGTTFINDVGAHRTTLGSASRRAGHGKEGVTGLPRRQPTGRPASPSK